jgi:ABC-type uncharacterized transport system permease subunit
MLLEDMPRPATLGADTLVSVLAVDAVTMLPGQRADRRALQGAHIIGMVAVTGEAVTGEAITGTRPLDIRWAITAWATAIHTTGVAITVGTIRLTAIIRGDTTLTATDTGRP